jgi:hypothetical protein
MQRKIIVVKNLLPIAIKSISDYCSKSIDQSVPAHKLKQSLVTSGPPPRNDSHTRQSTRGKILTNPEMWTLGILQIQRTKCIQAVHHSWL